MQQDRHIPTSLKIVAVLFILGGIFALIEMIISFAHNHMNINFAVIGLLIGPGLLALRPGWRTCALVFLWVAMIGVPIITIMMSVHPGPLDFKVFGQKVGYASIETGLVMAIIVFALTVWQYLILVRADVRKLFGLESG